MDAVMTVAPSLGVSATCAAFGVARGIYYRKRAPMHGPKRRRPAPSRKLPDVERGAVLAELHEPRFADLAPAQVHATLLDEGRVLCSPRTMHTRMCSRPVFSRIQGA